MKNLAIILVTALLWLQFGVVVALAAGIGLCLVIK